MPQKTKFDTTAADYADDTMRDAPIITITKRVVVGEVYESTTGVSPLRAALAVVADHWQENPPSLNGTPTLSDGDTVEFGYQGVVHTLSRRELT